MFDFGQLSDEVGGFIISFDASIENLFSDKLRDVFNASREFLRQHHFVNQNKSLDDFTH